MTVCMFVCVHVYIHICVYVVHVCVCSDTHDGQRIGVNRNNLLLRGCVLRNTTKVAGLVVYAGMLYIIYVYICCTSHICVGSVCIT